MTFAHNHIRLSSFSATLHKLKQNKRIGWVLWLQQRFDIKMNTQNIMNFNSCDNNSYQKMCCMCHIEPKSWALLIRRAKWRAPFFSCTCIWMSARVGYRKYKQWKYLLTLYAHCNCNYFSCTSKDHIAISHQLFILHIISPCECCMCVWQPAA